MQGELWTRNPKPETRNPELETRNLKPETRNPKSETRNPKSETRNPQPETRNMKPKTRIFPGYVLTISLWVTSLSVSIPLSPHYPPVVKYFVTKDLQTPPSFGAYSDFYLSLDAFSTQIRFKKSFRRPWSLSDVRLVSNSTPALQASSSYPGPRLTTDSLPS